MNKKNVLITGLVLLAILAAMVLLRTNYRRTHTFTLSTGDRGIAAEEIQPLSPSVQVQADQDTDVVFTEVQTGRTYQIGYLTPGMSESISLPQNCWYTVSAAGSITLGPVEVRIQ